ncbi:MAG: Fe-S cluster assembly protein SufB [Candidatus Anstonellales archaeon]
MPTKFASGIDREKVAELSSLKGEPAWMREKRLHAYEIFCSAQLPKWGPSLEGIDFSKLTYFSSLFDGKGREWSEVPDEIKESFEKLGIPEAERKFLAGVEAQYDSTVIYDSIKKEWEKQGVILTDMDTALKEHPDIVRKYFGTLIPPSSNKFAALNTAMWSGGAFVYVPKGVEVNMPLQAYFCISTMGLGQFERTLIVAESGSSLTYIEGCTAPAYPTYSLHSGVVEIIAKQDAKVKYITVQNWAKNVYNLVTKKAIAYDGAQIDWIDGNIGSKVTMKYPSIVLQGKRSSGRLLSIAYAGEGQCIDTGAKISHIGEDTSSEVVSKSISQGNGCANYRALITSSESAARSKCIVNCSSLLVCPESSAATYPKIAVGGNIELRHEATIGAIEEEKIHYLMSRGLGRGAAQKLLVLGFADDFIAELPFEYAIEFNRLLQTDIGGEP